MTSGTVPDHRVGRFRARLSRIALQVIPLAALVGAARIFATVGGGPDWGMIGNDSTNSRNQPFERTIEPANASRLAVKWVAATAGDVSATPAVVNGAVYFGDFGGMLWKLDAATGQVIWSHAVSDYTGIAGDIVRTSPSLAGNTLVVGDLRHPDMLGIDAQTGDLRWITQVHPDTKGIMTGSPVLAGDTIYTGVSALGASGPGATFRGAIVALNAQTGRIRGFTESCEQPGSFLKSVVAFDLKTGEPRWSYRVQGHGPWLQACGGLPLTVTWCAPERDGEKWDLGGSGVNVMRLRFDGHWRAVVGIGAKSGVYTLLDAKTGEFIWNTLVGPGGDQGGMEWGTAFDGNRIYASITNHHHIPYKLTENGLITNTTVTGGSWAALDPMTGTILWQTADPQVETLPSVGVVGVWDLAPVTVANGVVYAASMAKLAIQNQMFALDAASGDVLWQFGAGSSVNSGAAVVNGTVYWGSGYSRSGVEGSGNNALYAFSIDGR